MDFIERFFGLAPDNGNGTLEMLYLCLPLIAAIAVYVRRRKRNPKRYAAG